MQTMMSTPSEPIPITNKPVYIIQSFQLVTQFMVDGVSPLVICDIDHTLLRCSNDLSHYRNLVTSKYAEKVSFPVNVEHEATHMMNVDYCNGFVRQTDPEGFKQMLERIKQLDGRIVFLTARDLSSHAKTLNDFRNAGFDHPERFDIHYTNNAITKGDYIRSMDLDWGFQSVYFIDDYPSFLESVRQQCPHIQCFQFTYHNP